MASQDHMASREPSPAGGVKPSREADLQALLARVEAATGADRGLSVAIWYAFHPDPEELWALSGMNAQRGPRQNTERDLREAVSRHPYEYGWNVDDHYYTASLDAALALVERVAMPEPDFDLIFRQMGRSGVRWFIPERGHWLVTEAATPALSVCAALLKALAAQAASPESGSTGVWPNQSPTPLSKTEVQS